MSVPAATNSPPKPIASATPPATTGSAAQQYAAAVEKHNQAQAPSYKLAGSLNATHAAAFSLFSSGQAKQGGAGNSPLRELDAKEKAVSKQFSASFNQFQHSPPSSTKSGSSISGTATTYSPSVSGFSGVATAYSPSISGTSGSVSKIVSSDDSDDDEPDFGAAAAAQKALQAKVSAAQRNVVAGFDQEKRKQEGAKLASLLEDLDNYDPEQILQKKHLVWCFACDLRRKGMREKFLADRVAKYPPAKMCVQAQLSLELQVKQIDEAISLEIQEGVTRAWRTELLTDVVPIVPYTRDAFWAEFIQAHPKQTAEQKRYIETEDAVWEKSTKEIDGHLTKVAEGFKKECAAKGFHINAATYKSILKSGNSGIESFKELFVSRFSKETANGFKKFIKMQSDIKDFVRIDEAYKKAREKFDADLAKQDLFKKFAEINKKFAQHPKLENYKAVKFLPIPENEAILEEFNTFAKTHGSRQRQRLIDAFCASCEDKYPKESLSNFNKYAFIIDKDLEALDRQFDIFLDKEKRSQLLAFEERIQKDLTSQGVAKAEVVSYCKQREKLTTAFKPIYEAFVGFQQEQNATFEDCLENFCNLNAFGFDNTQLTRFVRDKAAHEASGSQLTHSPCNEIYDFFTERTGEFRKKVLSDVDSTSKTVWKNFGTPSEFETCVKKYEGVYIQSQVRRTSKVILELLTEYQTHSFDRFIRLINIHQDFINRSYLLHKAVKDLSPGAEAEVLTLIHKNFEEVTSDIKSNRIYRKTQGGHEDIDNDKCDENQAKVLEVLFSIFTPSVIETEFKKWQYAHTIPAPGAFSWTVEPSPAANAISPRSPTEASPSHRLIHKYTILQTYLNATDEAIKVLFQSTIAENLSIKPTATSGGTNYSEGIKRTMAVISLCSLHSASETERLPPLCNKVDRVAETGLAVDYKLTLMNGMKDMLYKLIETKTTGNAVAQLTLLETIHMQMAYLNETRISIFKELTELRKESVHLLKSNKKEFILNVMQQHMVCSMYYALRYTVITLGCQPEKDWPEVIPTGELSPLRSPKKPAAKPVATASSKK